MEFFFYLYHELQHVNVCVCCACMLFKDIFEKQDKTYYQAIFWSQQKIAMNLII